MGKHTEFNLRIVGVNKRPALSCTEKLNAYEYSVMDDVVFGHEDTHTSEEDELEDDLSLAGLDATELEYMDADERREALEDAGLDPDDYDFD